MLTSFVLSMVLLASGLAPAPAQGVTTSTDKTEIRNVVAAKQLVGRHKFQLHWISWNKWKEFANLSVIDRGGVYVVKGRQSKGEDYVEVDGRVVSIDAKEFKFSGRIVTRVSYKNNGQPCERNGEMTFKITGQRKYWRLQEMQSPCDETTDYVDIFLR